MKQIALPTRLNVFLTNILDALVSEDELPTKSSSEKGCRTNKQYRPERKDFFYYMQLIDMNTNNTVGQLSDISSGGFKLDSQNPVPVNKDFRFRMNLTAEVANKPFMVFSARSRWCQIDPIDPYTYNVGYQLVNISSQDLEIFNRVMEKYGKENTKTNINLRRSNKW
jgi:hypothetical protein